ncbi:class I SAM-dependent methyltransferase [bacterium]|nr:class I SAM-dependent methyltransferase [bacterium]
MSWRFQKKYESRVNGWLLHPALRINFYDLVMQKLLPFNDSFYKQLMLQTDMKNGETVLDLGCGTGSLSIFMQKAHPQSKIFGIDASEAMIAECEKKRKVGLSEAIFKQSSAENLPFDDETFDSVVASFLLSYIPQTIKPTVLKEVFRVLKPHGKLIIIDPNKQYGLKKVWNLINYIPNPFFVEDGLEGNYLQMLEEAEFSEIYHLPGFHKWMDIPFITAFKK